MNLRYIVIPALIVIAFVACKNVETTKSQSGVDLLKYGIADKINPPSNAVVTHTIKGKLTGVSISASEGLEVQAVMSLSYTQDFKKLIQDRKREILTDPFFVKIVEETDNGFLFEKQVSPTTKAYDFRIIKLIGDNEVTYMCGISKEYSESEAKSMMKWISK
jgi:hypothetical protein